MLITQSLPEFTRAIENNEPVICNKKGEWKIPSAPIRFIQQIFRKNNLENSVFREFHKVLSQVETSKLFFGASAERMSNQRKFYQDLLRAGHAITRIHAASTSEKVKEQCNGLELSLLKMQYRIQLENGGLRVLNPEEVDANLADQMRHKVEAWKRTDEKYQHTQPQDFSAKIREICRYTEIANFILNPKNKKDSNEYLQMFLRDNLSLQVLNQYYYESKNLAKNKIVERMGAIARDLLTVDLTPSEDGSLLKTLNLLMENHKVNLLDKKQSVHFSNGLVWTLDRIYRDFHEKWWIPGDLEIMRNGVIPFNSHEMGPQIVQEENKFLKHFFKPSKQYDSIDTTQPRWFEKTPCLDIRSKEYIEARYNIQIQPGEWVAVLEGTRRNELDVVKSHGYSVFYQPMGENQYRVYTFGAFPLKFPQNNRQILDFVGNTVDGTLTTDPNYYYSQSQKASKAFPVNEKVALALLEEIGMLRKIGIIFQFPWENCSYLMRNVFNKVFRNMNVPVVIPTKYFEKKFLHMKPHGALRIVQNLFAKVQEELLPLIKVIIAAFFRATRSKHMIESGRVVKKCLWHTPFFRQLKVNVPSTWHWRIKKDRIAKANDPDYKEKFADCVLNYGHTSNR